MDDKHFRELLDHLGLSYAGYRKVRKGVKKRIARHMERLGCRDMAAYILALKEKDGSRRQCERLMTVSISRFFRDRALWETLEDRILPRIIKRDVETVRVWSAGCASGEEVYSMKILWALLQRRFDALPKLEILATDMNPAYLARGRAGIYPQSSLKEVSGERRAVFFEPPQAKNYFAVKPFLRTGIIWQCRHLLVDAPEKHFHVIFLRNNLLTYYEAGLKEPAFQRVIERLEPEGHLIIGAHEKIPSATPGLAPVREHPCVFSRRDRTSP